MIDLIKKWFSKDTRKEIVYIRKLKRQYTINGITVNEYDYIEEVAA